MSRILQSNIFIGSRVSLSRVLEDQARGLTFDKFEEKLVSQVIVGINLSGFGTVVERIATRNSLPNDKKDEILGGQ